MTGKERMKIAMSGGQPDRVPVMCQLSTGHIAVNADCPPVELDLDTEAFVRNYLNLIRRYRFDGLLVASCATFNHREDVAAIEDDPQGQLATFKDGRKVLYPFDETPRALGSSPVACLADMDPESIDVWEKVPPDATRMHRMFLERAGNQLSIHGSLASPFTLFVEAFGITQPFIALIEDGDLCSKILEKYTVFYANWGKAQIDVGIDALVISSPWSGSTFISKEMYQQFVLPFETQLVRELKRHKKDIVVYNHTCGFINDRLELIVESGIDGIECMDPPPLGNVELADAKKRIGDRVFLKGNLDSPNTLLRLDKAKVGQIARQRILEGGPNGGYILSSACSVSPHVPPQNLEVLADIAEEYGRYPLRAQARQSSLGAESHE